jgi:hypothetical protein
VPTITVLISADALSFCEWFRLLSLILLLLVLSGFRFSGLAAVWMTDSVEMIEEICFGFSRLLRRVIIGEKPPLKQLEENPFANS